MGLEQREKPVQRPQGRQGLDKWEELEDRPEGQNCYKL